EEQQYTVVLDTDSFGVIATFENWLLLLTGSSGMWLGNDEFVAFSDVDVQHLAIIQVDASTSHCRQRLIPHPLTDGYIGGSNGRFVQSSEWLRGTDTTQVYTSNLDGSDRQLFITLRLKADVNKVEIPSTDLGITSGVRS
ncbi:hypothetical protein, partial [Phytoactinopolyspora halophila]